MTKERLSALLPFFVFIVGFVFSILFTMYIHNFTSYMEQSRFNNAAKAIENEIINNENLLTIFIKSIANTFTIAEQITQDDFNYIADSISLNKRPFGIEIIGYSPFVLEHDIKHFEKKYNIKVQPITPKSAFPVQFYAPVDENTRSAYGFNQLSNIYRSRAINQATYLRDITKTMLVQFSFAHDNDTEHRGVIYFDPIYKQDTLQGVIFIGISPKKFYNLALAKSYVNCDIEVYESLDLKKPPIFDSNPMLKDAKYEKIVQIAINNNTQTIIFKSNTIANLGLFQHVSLLILLFGTILSVLTAIIINNLQKRKSDALNLAKVMTSNFQDQMLALEKSVIFIDRKSVV